MSLIMDMRSKPDADPARADNLGRILESITTLAAELWPVSSQQYRRLQAMRKRLADECLNLAVLGQFKRGKSTVLNALLGQPLLPTGVVPLTAIPTFIKWGADPVVRVVYKTGHEPSMFTPATPDEIQTRLFAFVAEAANPENRLAVDHVELFYSAEILRRAVSLIDTPGIGSTYRHNTQTALQVLSDCDAAIFVTSADPPVTEAELAYLHDVRTKVGQVVFILNKADYLEATELATAEEFLRKTLLDAGIHDPHIFPLSALRGLRAKMNRDRSALDNSALPALETFLLRYLADGKATSLRTAITKKSLQLLDNAADDATLQIRALEIPLADLENRSAVLAAALAQIEDESRVIPDFLAGDQHRVMEELETDAERIRQAAVQHFLKELRPILREAGSNLADHGLREKLATEIPDFFAQKLSEISGKFSDLTESMLRKHQERIGGLVNLVRRTAAELFDAPFRPVEQPEAFRLKREPYWVTQRWDATLLPSPKRMGRRFLRRNADRAEQEVRDVLAELAGRNVENLRWATLQSVQDVFRKSEAELHEYLTDSINATLGSVRAIAQRRRSTSAAADNDLRRLRDLSSRIVATRNLLTEYSQVAAAAC